MSDYLPSEVIINILSRVPAKSLVKFRCVCKSWRSLISSSDFTSAHLHLPTKPPLLLLRHSSLAPTYKEIYSLRFDDGDFTSLLDLHCPFKTESGCFFRVVGCCNGVICLSDDYFSYTDTIILWNPAIRRYLTLPRPNLRFGDSDNSHFFALGFGFDPKTNDHKIIRIVYQKAAGEGRTCRKKKKKQAPDGKVWGIPPRVEVYALSTGKWKTVKDVKIGYHLVEFFWSSVFANGRVHWMAYSGGKFDGYCNVILVFDVGSEMFREMKLPRKLVSECPLNLAVVAYRDSIAVFQYEDRFPYTGKDFTVWVMKQSSGEVVAEKWDGNLVSCQPGRIKKMGICGGKESFYLGTYAESLILLDGGIVVPTEDTASSAGADDSSDDAAVLSDAKLDELSRFHYMFAASGLNA
ncbi:hypothetical protein Vadar_033154 [Vaccinium darrowii]|uniref:Uncharacterized protein n=1 Tax=Vaccinium darrowii TaxID=229202 RepID=A0ACB7YJT8_9ERIC|nr:hypothetical protein Vadar_033154 [Vaccinium darrowii]